MLKQWCSAILLCIAASCASVQQVQPQNTTKSYIEVDNGGWSDVVIYAMVGSSTVKTRLGYVSSMTRARIPLFKTLVDHELRLMVQPLASNAAWISDAMQVMVDERVELHVMEPLQFSYFGIWKIE